MLGVKRNESRGWSRAEAPVPWRKRGRIKGARRKWENAKATAPDDTTVGIPAQTVRTKR
jgi:hypothetical protein